MAGAMHAVTLSRSLQLSTQGLHFALFCHLSRIAAGLAAGGAFGLWTFSGGRRCGLGVREDGRWLTLPVTEPVTQTYYPAAVCHRVGDFSWCHVPLNGLMPTLQAPAGHFRKDPCWLQTQHWAAPQQCIPTSQHLQRCLTSCLPLGCCPGFLQHCVCSKALGIISVETPI